MTLTNNNTVDFIVQNLKDKSATEYFANDAMKRFIELALQGKEIAAAQEYTKVTDCAIGEAIAATKIAKALFS